MGRSKEDHAKEVRASRVLKKLGREEESLVAALRGESVPVLKDAMTQVEIKAVEIKQAMNDLGLGLEYERMNQSHQKLGQDIQNLVVGLLSDPEWREAHLKLLTPDKVVKILELGMKIERDALANQMSAQRAREANQGAMSGGKLKEIPQDLTKRLFDDPNSIDYIHKFADILEHEEE